LAPEEIEQGWPYEGTYLDDQGHPMRGRYRLKTKPEVQHAERNALDKLARQGGRGGADSVMFVTHAPCLECAKSIYGAGVQQVYFRDHYRSDDGIQFLEQCGIPVTQISTDV
jgi:dCMP deaminase